MKISAKNIGTKSVFYSEQNSEKSDAPISPNTGKHVTYQRFDCFVRAVILREVQEGE